MMNYVHFVNSKHMWYDYNEHVHTKIVYDS